MGIRHFVHDIIEIKQMSIKNSIMRMKQNENNSVKIENGFK